MSGGGRICGTAGAGGKSLFDSVVVVIVEVVVNGSSFRAGAYQFGSPEGGGKPSMAFFICNLD